MASADGRGELSASELRQQVDELQQSVDRLELRTQVQQLQQNGVADDAAASKLWLSGSVRKDGARDLLSGMISGFFCKILEYPFDTIKVLEQTGGAKYSGPLDAARKTIAESGIWSLYNGLTAPLLGSMAECASLFVAYGMIKNALGVDEEAATLEYNVPMWKYVLAGGGSGCCSTCVLTPVELVKCRLQAQTHRVTASGT